MAASPHPIDTETFRQSLTTLLRNKNAMKPPNDPAYVEGARRILEFMNCSWQQQKLCDVLISSQDGDLQAHRIALGAYSQNLASILGMYSSGDVIRLDLSDFQAEAVINILQFLYTTDLNLDCRTVSQVLSCANELGITEIVNACLEYLIRNCNAGNAILHLLIANNFGLRELQNYVLQFILKNFTQIVSTPQFVHLSPEQLKCILCDDRLCIESERVAFDAVVKWVNYDEQNRKQFIIELFECVRFQLMSINEIIALEPQAMIFFSDAGWKTLYGAMKVRALLASGRSVPCNIQRPRMCHMHSVCAEVDDQQHPISAHSTDVDEKTVASDAEKRVHTAPKVGYCHRRRPSRNFGQHARVHRTHAVVYSSASRTTASPPVAAKRHNGNTAAKQPAKPQPTSVTSLASLSGTDHSMQKQPKTEISNVTVNIDLAPDPAQTLCMKSRPEPNPVELVAIGGLDLQTETDEVPGRLVFNYNSQRNAWDQWPVRLNGYLHHHGVIAVDKRIYIVGGAVYTAAKPDNLGVATNEVNVYDLAFNGVWFTLASMHDCRAYHAVAGWRSFVFAVCGEDENKKKLDTIECYHPKENKWVTVATLPSGPKVGVSAAVVGDALYVVGGFNKERPAGCAIASEVERFNIISQSWSIMNMLPLPRCHASLVEVQGRLFLVGGRTRNNDGSVMSLDLVDEYDEVTDQWLLFARLQTARHDASCAAAGSLLNIVGGMQAPSPYCLQSFECFDVATREYFEGMADYPYPIAGLGLCAIVRTQTIEQTTVQATVQTKA